MGATNSDRQRRHRQRMNERGLVQVSIVVPIDRLDAVKRLAERLRWRHNTTIIRDDD